MSYIGRPTKGAFENFSCGTGDFRGATPLWLAAFTANGGLGGGFAADAAAGGDDGADARADSIAPAIADPTQVIEVLLAAGADLKLDQRRWDDAVDGGGRSRPLHLQSEHQARPALRRAPRKRSPCCSTPVLTSTPSTKPISRPCTARRSAG